MMGDCFRADLLKKKVQFLEVYERRGEGGWGRKEKRDKKRECALVSKSGCAYSPIMRL